MICKTVRKITFAVTFMYNLLLLIVGHYYGDLLEYHAVLLYTWIAVEPMLISNNRLFA